MATDIKSTFYSHTDVLPLATGAAVSEEGQGLIQVFEDGVEKVAPSADAGGEVFVGFALFRQVDFSTRPLVEEITVPTAAPLEVTLDNNNLVAGQIRVYDVAADADLTETGGVPASGEFRATDASGLLEFHADEAGKDMQVFYRYNMTVAEAKLRFYEAPINYPDPNFFETVGVGKGKGRLYTFFYDTSAVFDETSELRLGADGIISTTAAGAAGALIPNARVIKAPNPGLGGTPLTGSVTGDNAALGIEFNA